MLKNFIRAPQAPAWEVQRTAGAVVGAISAELATAKIGHDSRHLFHFSALLPTLEYRV